MSGQKDTIRQTTNTALQKEAEDRGERLAYRYHVPVNQKESESGLGWLRALEPLQIFLTHRIARSLYWVLGVMMVGAVGFFLIVKFFSSKPYAHGFLDSLYLAVITLTTVGYGDNLELLSLPEPGRTVGAVFSIIYLLVAYGVVVWASSMVVAYLVEGSLSGVLLKRRILRKIEMLKDHYILCGIGRAGAAILDEFRKTGNSLVIVEWDKNRLATLAGNLSEEELLFIEGDATEEDVLIQARITRARGIICNLSNDRDNLFLTLTARAMNPTLRIISRGIEQKSRPKILRAGADSVVYTSNIGAMRMASEMIRPTVVSFLDKMLRDPRQQMRVSEVALSDKSKYSGMKIKDAGIYSDTGLNVVALLPPDADGEGFVYNPSPEMELRAGSILVVIGSREQVSELAKRANPEKEYE